MRPAARVRQWFSNTGTSQSNGLKQKSGSQLGAAATASLDPDMHVVLALARKPA